MRIALWTTALAAALAGCREPPADTHYQPDAGEFDAAPDDDGGVGDLCPQGSPDPFNNAYSPYAGGEESVGLEVVDYSYFRCHFCAQLAPMWEAMLANRPDIRARVRLYYHHFPQVDEEGWQVHAASVAAANQGMESFWALHDYIYAKYNEESVILGPESIRAYCDEVLGLDMAQFDEDVAADETMAFLEWDKAQAVAQDVTGTPAVFVCGVRVSWSHLEEVIDSYLGE